MVTTLLLDWKPRWVKNHADHFLGHVHIGIFDIIGFYGAKIFGVGHAHNHFAAFFGGCEQIAAFAVKIVFACESADRNLPEVGSLAVGELAPG